MTTELRHKTPSSARSTSNKMLIKTQRHRRDMTFCKLCHFFGAIKVKEKKILQPSKRASLQFFFIGSPSTTFHFTFLFLPRSGLVHSSSAASHGSVCLDSHRCVAEFHLPSPLILLLPGRLSNGVAREVRRGPAPVCQISPTPPGSIGELRELSYH